MSSGPTPRREAPQDARGLAEMLGGTRGMVEATIPGVVFAVAYPITGARLGPSLVVALVSAAVLGAVALWHRRPVQQVVASLIGVGIMAGWAAWRGRPEAFYFPSIVKNAAYCSVYVISCLVRWPLLGVVLGPLLGEGMSWRKDPARYRAYLWASWVWAGMFGIRLAVQIPLYVTERTTALGFANIPLGLPLFLLTCAITWAILRSTHPVQPEAEEPTVTEEPGPVAGGSVVGREDFLQEGLGLGSGHEQQLVAGLDGVVGGRGDDPPVPQDRHEGGVRGPGDVADPVPGQR